MKNIADKYYHLVELYFGKWDDMYFPVIYTDKAISENELVNEVKRAHTLFVQKSADVDNPFILGKGIYNKLIHFTGFRVATRSLFVIIWNPESVRTKFYLSYENESWINENIVSSNSAKTEADAFQIMTFDETHHLNTYSSFLKPNKKVKEFQNACTSIISLKDIHSFNDLSAFHDEFERLLIEKGFELYPHIQHPISKSDIESLYSNKNDF